MFDTRVCKIHPNPSKSFLSGLVLQGNFGLSVKTHLKDCQVVNLCNNVGQSYDPIGYDLQVLFRSWVFAKESLQSLHPRRERR